MYTTAIDRHALKGLFDNQKKLDELFDSIFDDEKYFISSTSPSISSLKSSHVAYGEGSLYAPEQSRVAELLSMIKNHCPYFFLLPIVLEVVVIYFIFTSI